MEYAAVSKRCRSFIYRSYNSGPYGLIGIVSGMDGSFVDYNIIAPPISNDTAPQAAYISTTTPTSVAVNGILASRITGISGTTLTLAASAINTATSQPAAHDNSPVVYAGCAALGGGGSGIFLSPAAGTYLSTQF